MAEETNPVAVAIRRAQEHLQEALSALAASPARDPAAIAFAAEALMHYLEIQTGTLDLVVSSLPRQTAPQVLVWLEGLQHVTALMTHTVRRLEPTDPGAPPPLHVEPVELALTVERVCRYFQRLAAVKRLTLRHASAPAVPPVRTDRVAVVVALHTLLANALKFAPPDTTITVTLEANPTSVTCRVHDEGPGLRADEQTQLFQRGVRLSPPPTGYGLAVAKELLDAVGGEIWCESTPGQGATFAVRLPVAPPEARD
jgi:signal transduction histidine kinase